MSYIYTTTWDSIAKASTCMREPGRREGESGVRGVKCCLLAGSVSAAGVSVKVGI